MTTWFCDAYASWNGVENANGRLRRWLPRHIDIDKVSDEEIQDIVLTTNLTPRKCLGFNKRCSRQSSKNLAKTCKSASHRPLHLARIDARLWRLGIVALTLAVLAAAAVFNVVLFNPIFTLLNSI